MPAPAAELKTDDDFLLTPLEETADMDGSESGSQVIALDTETEDSATMIGAGSGVSMAAMLDEDLSPQPGLEMGVGGPLAGPPVLGMQPSGLAEGAAPISPAAALGRAALHRLANHRPRRSAPCCLALCGMMMYDLLRSMWSWEQPFTITSRLMEHDPGLDRPVDRQSLAGRRAASKQSRFERSRILKAR